MNEVRIIYWLNEVRYIEDSIDLMQAIATEGLKVAVCLKNILSDSTTNDNVCVCSYTISFGDVIIVFIYF